MKQGLVAAPPARPGRPLRQLAKGSLPPPHRGATGRRRLRRLAGLFLARAVLGHLGGALARLQDGFVIEDRLVHRGPQSSTFLPFVILRRSAAETGGPSGAKGDLFRQDVGSVGMRDSFALSRAAGFPGLRRADAACRRMTKERAGADRSAQTDSPQPSIRGYARRASGWPGSSPARSRPLF